MNFRVASFNVLNLVRPGVRYYDLPVHAEDEHEHKLKWIAQTLDRSRADIVGFQEVFSSSSLQAAVEYSQNFHDHVQVLSPGADTESNEEDGKALRPKVGLATRFQILRHESIKEFPTTADFQIPSKSPEGIEQLIDVPIKQFERPPLRAEILIPETDITVVVYVAHLKSKRPIYKEGEDRENPIHRSLGSLRAQVVRSIEATALRTRLVKDIEKNKQPLIVLGDLNDTVESTSTQIIAGDSPDFRWPLKIKRMYWDVLLYSTNTIQTRQDLKDFGYTHIHHGRRDVLDHILVSQEFYHRNSKRIGKVTYQHIFNDHLFDWSLTARESDRIMSDHGIPVAEIELDKFD
ncbi:MAG: endonuclease/exonuclease/phosphatase family protein [Gammaproteobacteria bacterium]|nr:endonuclease/exonuclease/phosphatase family protein [Gammaproteobacteria bacterium]